MVRARRTESTSNQAVSCLQSESDLAARPEIGTQEHFKSAKPPAILTGSSGRESAQTSPPKDQSRLMLAATSAEGVPLVAILFGPENGPISERLVYEAWDEAGLKHRTHPHVIGYAIDREARQFNESAGKIAVEVIDPRGNEFLVVKQLKETK